MSRCYWALALPLLCASCQDPDRGTGPITLSPGTEASFAEYTGRDAPLYFVVTEDGRGSYYVYCVGGFNCTSSAARMRALDECSRRNAGHDCKIYAIGRSIVWQDAEGKTVASAPPAARPAPELSPSARLVRDCLDGPTPAIRIQRCSDAIASAELAERDKRGPYYVRARAYEEIGDVSLAEGDYRAVLRIDPKHVAARARL
ncbi:MAG TPA: hypothetical protein VLE23_13935, partial [Geminicoccaceae bacterium]|nr:hypothetical protein [Geminicoccaceae bacterium]